ncbi:MAG: hypothetical protein A3C06_01225 [Candidatus Taylorbacteria bacterium RIFCSPHIGHO2_02_FULL_46_13]|uniref:Bacterial spore germination immunoglobulin-like domain-containing protein n=1 Tax=Candidatus Taylorbacteria bacterium RIFCSPHIGHO2_02_FULL_46_13 TaxID=1802312 RepID=A0A1G2MS71_9BACT|nr:MAG: hypothetical protein A3C06_01225 [Candidatus Taylorbacteria bacterium RIFCSPHIGHO2_02_FULL_46_13]
MKKIIIFVVLVVVCILGWYALKHYTTRTISSITTFEECAQAGYPIMESYPRQCRTPDGRNFVEQISVATSTLSDLIVVDSPKPGATVKSPIHISGKARGNWYFEASFPVILKDVNGKVIIQTPMQAKGDWMTTEFVPFELDLALPTSTVPGPVTLILQKDNPSGLPQHDAQIEIPLIIGAPATAGACRPTGCSGQVCSDKDVITTCEYRAEYACYKTAKCERQVSGQCGWTPSVVLTQCLANPPAVE